MEIPQPGFIDDDALSLELARANLARVRGEYDIAENLCLELLRKTPSEPTLQSLLGDIAAEQGKLEDAVHWYSLAVAAGAPVIVRGKLAGIEDRIQERDSNAMAEQIGLSSRAESPWLMVLAITVVVVVVTAIGFIFSARYGPPHSPARGTIFAPVVANAPDTPAPLPDPNQTLQEAPNAAASTPPATTQPVNPSAPAVSPAPTAHPSSNDTAPGGIAAIFDSVGSPFVAATDVRTDFKTLTATLPPVANEDPSLTAARATVFAFETDRFLNRVKIHVSTSGSGFDSSIDRTVFSAYEQSHGDALPDSPDEAHALFSGSTESVLTPGSTGQSSN